MHAQLVATLGRTLQRNGIVKVARVDRVDRDDKAVAQIAAERVLKRRGHIERKPLGLVQRGLGIAIGIAVARHHILNAQIGRVISANAAFDRHSARFQARRVGQNARDNSITRVDTHQKRAYNDDISRPKFALMDPELTKTLPDYQTESGCADIMMHTMERYFTNGGNMELTDALAEGLLRTVMKNAVILHTDPANYEARAEVMWAGSLSHNGLTGCGIASGDFMSHKLEHEMGGMFDVTHGAGLAALWPSWARYVYKDCLPRFVRFARNVMGVTTDGTDEEIALKGIEAMVDFYHSIGMPASFHELGIDPTDAQIDEMAHRCLEACGSALGSAKKLSLDDMIAIYRAANH